MNQDKDEIAREKPSEAQAVDRIQKPIVGTPRSAEACADAEVWASRNPKGRVVPYRLAARMERELAEAIAERDSERRWADQYAAEAHRLIHIVENVHDRILRGDTDKELMALLECGWKERAVISRSFNPAVRGRESPSVPCTGVVGTPNQKGDA